MGQPRIVIVGAGPAGVRAAQALVERDIRPVVVDESRRDGGQIYRRQPEGFRRPYTKLYGSEANKAEALHRSFELLRDRIDWHAETLAWNVEPNRLHVVQAGQAQVLPFDALIVCSGATDRVMPVPGWDLAGCYSMGAAQISLKSQACSIGQRVVFMGSGPLLYLVASQYVAAGAQVEAVLDTSASSLRVRALPRLAARPAVLLNGLKLVASLRLAGVRLMTGIKPVEITGSPREGVTGIRVCDGRGREHLFKCDAVALGYHLRSEAQIADIAKCEFHFDAGSRQWLPRIDEDGRSSVRGIYLAGDGVRLAGADGAEASGRLAALACMADLNMSCSQPEVAELRAKLRTVERFRQGLLQAFPWPHEAAAELPDSTVVCRCEVVTAGELRTTVSELGACEINRAKALCRVGMGRCQGRYCGHAAAEVVAHAAKIPVEQVGRIRSQGPVKPFPISTIAVRGAQ
ncbi:FAD/NAD(P)-binding oxidoreductase [Variovorax guangxiensis]|uniref:FAD/NAD(P)-dependent oxidoreductase n=1 Tax=Variovorax guangxiensis TaxID=1775474 RepID=UPI002860238A|nr:FAD/NAD(P)-binding oxidoreductase [Variovorax guangxiensis]MDR6861454.1 NADPH-dependent 2,4-dienoyl-CoA reductase/sulfur reductase-like enzyme [Variovorax guangxiensis]